MIEGGGGTRTGGGAGGGAAGSFPRSRAHRAPRTRAAHPATPRRSCRGRSIGGSYSRVLDLRWGGEVDLRAVEVVEVAGEEGERRDGQDLGQLAVVEPRLAGVGDVGVGEVPPGQDDLP